MALAQIAILAAVAVAAIRGAHPAPPPYRRRFSWIGFLLLLQLVLLSAFLAFDDRSGGGAASAWTEAIAALTQLVRLALLVLAGRAWVEMALAQLPRRWERLLVLAAFLLLASGDEVPRLGAAVGLFFLLRRMKWIEGVSGWRRAAGLVLAVGLLLPLSLTPVVTAAKSHLQFSVASSPWPPSLLAGDAARSARALMRPLDQAIQGILDLFRIQLLVCAVQFLFLPIRLSGVSLKRRFWLNYVLVRSIPSLFSAIVVLGVLYLGVGYARGVQVREAFERTLARATTAARALGDDPWAGDRAARAGMERLRDWMAPDGERALVVARSKLDPSVRATPGTPSSILAPPLSSSDTSLTRGLYVRGGAIYLVAVRRWEKGATEVWVPVDSGYLERTLRTLGGSARLTSRPQVFVGANGLRMADSTWTAQAVTVGYVEPPSIAGRGTAWFLNRQYLPVGNWRDIGARWRGAAELTLETTPRSLVMASVRARGSLYSSFFLVVIAGGVAMLFGMLEGFAVRSGKSILKAVLEDVGALRKAADEFGAGHLDYRLTVRGKDEFSIVASSFNDMAMNLERQRRELVAAERVEEDLAVARGIQQRFLPQQAPRIPGLDIAGVSIPSKEVGGDLFYWFARDDGPLGFVVGDVSGKSVPAALVMSNVLAALRTQAVDRVELAACLERTNRLLFEQVEPGRFVTLFYGEADPASGALRYVSAGHHPALVAGRGGIVWLREGGVPLGVLPQATYRAASLDLAPGDTLVVYSDGVTEAERRSGDAAVAGAGAQPELFGEDRLATVARELHGRSAREVLEGVLAAVRAFAGDTEQADDVTIVVVRRT